MPPAPVAVNVTDWPRSIPGALGDIAEIIRAFGVITLKIPDSMEFMVSTPALEESLTMTFAVNVPACVDVYV